MTREHKLALIVGFALFLVVGVLVSDHFSSARKSQPGSGISALGPREAGASSIQPPVTGTMSSQEIVMGGSGIGDRYQSMPPTSRSLGAARRHLHGGGGARRAVAGHDRERADRHEHGRAGVPDRPDATDAGSAGFGSFARRFARLLPEPGAARQRRRGRG